MPIVNGQYVMTPLPTSEDAQKQVFSGQHTRKDMADYSQAAYNYLMQQQQNAYELEMWNLKNQYDSPAAQMQRYQDAGLNPNLIYGQQNVSGNTPQASPATFRSTGTYAHGAQQAMAAIGQVMNTVKAARETYDYIKYGTEQNAWNIALTRNQGEALSLRNLWDRWLLGRGDDNTVDPSAPKRVLWQTQQDINEKKYAQLVAVVSSIENSTARTRALKALDDYRLQILKGQYGFLSQINTGSHGLDAFLQMLGFWLLAR